MKHLFDVSIAQKYGVYAAIILENLGYWVKQNKENDINFFDGRYWSYNSRRAYRGLFPYMSERQINTAFKKLIDDGLVITGNYNQSAYDRTLWYTLTDRGFAILHFDTMEEVKTSNQTSQNVEPIPLINHYMCISPIGDIHSGVTSAEPMPAPASSSKKKFIPPTLDEVAAYCNERHNGISPSAFIDYYEARGWKYGTGKPMVNWKAAVRTWEQKEKGRTHVQSEQQRKATEEVNARIFEELFGGEPT